MNFSCEYINDILSAYNIPGAAAEIFPLLEARYGAVARYVLRVRVDGGVNYVVKLTCDNRYPPARNERKSRFSECLRRNGIPTPLRYISDGMYCISRPYGGFGFDVTVEDYVGEELKFYDMPTAREAGELLARCHEISLRENCSIGAPTLFELGKYHEMNAYETFCGLRGTAGLDAGLYGAVISAYDARLERALSALADCPRGACQGDISHNNLARQNGKLWMFDYNNAGDDYFAADMITQGIFVSRDMDYAAGHEPSAMFGAFVRGYTERRPLTEAESCAAGHYHAVSSAMWASGIVESCDGSLIRMIKRGDFGAANSRLVDMLEQLTVDS